MPEAKAPVAFISYCREDSEFALRLAQDLKDAGAGVWIDQLDIAAGQLWDNAIEDALTASPRMLLVLSPGAARSNNVRNEISFALDQGKTIIPVLYKDCTVPLQLQRANRIDFRADYARGLTALLTNMNVAHPDSKVLHEAARAEVKRKVAWQARESEARRLQQIQEVQRRDEADRLVREAELRDRQLEAQRISRQQAGRSNVRSAPSTVHPKSEPAPRGTSSTLWTITFTLFILWIVGLISGYTMGGWIHILLILAVIVMVFKLLSSRVK